MESLPYSVLKQFCQLRTRIYWRSSKRLTIRSSCGISAGSVSVCVCVCQCAPITGNKQNDNFVVVAHCCSSISPPALWLFGSVPPIPQFLLLPPASAYIDTPVGAWQPDEGKVFAKKLLASSQHVVQAARSSLLSTMSLVLPRLVLQSSATADEKSTTMQGQGLSSQWLQWHTYV